MTRLTKTEQARANQEYIRKHRPEQYARQHPVKGTRASRCKCGTCYKCIRRAIRKEDRNGR